jgi:hypothetical protein
MGADLDADQVGRRAHGPVAGIAGVGHGSGGAGGDLADDHSDIEQSAARRLRESGREILQLVGRITIRRYESPRWGGLAFGSNPPYGLQEVVKDPQRFSDCTICEDGLCGSRDEIVSAFKVCGTNRAVPPVVKPKARGV